MAGCGAKCQCPTFREHVQSIGTLTQGRSDWHKTTTHRTVGETTVDVTEHFDGRVDVTAKPERVVVKAKIGQEG
jgi:hypothetical protein